MKRCAPWVVLSVSLLWAQPGAAGERYFVLMFGSQQVQTIPDYAHSFAVFVRVSGGGEGAGFAYHTISWLPANMDLRPFALLPEPGRNFDLHTTLRHVLA